MKIKEMCIKTLAVILIVGAAAAAYGRELLIVFAKKGSDDKSILVKTVKTENSAIAKIENNVLDKRRISMATRDFGDFPFLVKGIKYNCLQEGECLKIYNSNQEMIYNITLNMCVYYSYHCDIGKSRYTSEQCRCVAREGVYGAFLSGVSPVITECMLVSDDKLQCTYALKTDKTGEAELIVKIRKDTGKIILFDAHMAEETFSINTDKFICDKFDLR